MTAAKRAKKKRPVTRSVAALGVEDAEGFGIWMRRHLEWMRVRNYSEATLKKREPCLVFFVEWCAARGIARPREVTRPILESYRRHLFYYR